MDRLKNFAFPPRILVGIPLSDGRGEGRIVYALSGVPQRFNQTHTISDKLIKSEIGRMRHAVQLFSLVLENSIREVTARLGESYAAMFVALREMLHDPMLLDAILEQIQSKHIDAGSAMSAVLESLRKRLSDAPSPYLRERANDLLGLQGSLFDALAGQDNLMETTKSNGGVKGNAVNIIAIVETLTPRIVLDLNKQKVNGIACERAGPTSHAAILCRAFEIPAVEGIKHILKQLPQGEYAMIDGANGIIGTANLRKALLPLIQRDKLPGIAGGKGIDFSKITLLANLNLAQNAITALAAGAQGIGLYRTEFEFIDANRLLTEHEQFLRYRNVVIAMMGLPVTIRLIDIAVDKSTEIFDAFGGHIDPSCSGAEFLLSWPELLETQARAIVRTASFGPVRILYPMVADAEQFVRLKKVISDAVGKEVSAKIRHGAMIEQPSAVNDARNILEEADFACIGTNDLTKHLLHVDRETAVAHSAEIVGSPILWDAIGHVVSMASTFEKELTVCGEMASDLRLLKRFVEIDIKTFSMDIHKIRHIRKRIINALPVE